MTYRRRVLSAAITGIALLVSVESARAQAEPQVENGDAVADAPHSGLVMILNGSFCSGALLTNDWAITASHCEVDPTNPSATTIRMGNLGDPLAQSTTADFVVRHPSLDFSLLHLRQAFVIDADTSRYRTGMYPDSSFSLIGQPLLFYGYSDNHCDMSGCTGFGVLRTASV